MAVVFPYAKNTSWVDGSGGGTPITATKLNVYEDGIFNAHQAPAVRVTHSTTQSITDSTETSLAFDTERYDTAGGAASTQHDTVTNNSRLTCRYAGKYLITANCEWASNTSNRRYIRVRLNGATYIASLDLFAATTNGTPAMIATTIYDMAVNDYVEVRVWQNSGGALNVVNSANYSPEFMMVRVA